MTSESMSRSLRSLRWCLRTRFFIALITLMGLAYFILSSAPRAPRVQRDAALVFFGTAGLMRQSDRGQPPSTKAVRVGFASVSEKLLAFNSARGWHIDVFFHTWDAPLEAELAALLQPAAHAVSGNGGLVSGYGLPASVENALTVMRRYVSSKRGGVPYERVVALRFDALLLRSFELDKLDDARAVFVASWCKAAGRIVLRDGSRVCRELVYNSNDLNAPTVVGTPSRHGLPDFFFAGSPNALWRLFHGLHAWMLSVPVFNAAYVAAAATGGSWPGGAHFILGERVKQKQLSIRRYLQHHMDIDLVRELSCGGAIPAIGASLSRAQCASKQLDWLRRNSSDVSSKSESYCDRGEAFCACSERQLAECYAFV